MEKSSSKDKLQIARRLDQSLNQEPSDGNRDPNLRRFPLPLTADPWRQLHHDSRVATPWQRGMEDELAKLVDNGFLVPAGRRSVQDCDEKGGEHIELPAGFEAWARRCLESLSSTAPLSQEAAARVPLADGFPGPHRFEEKSGWDTSQPAAPEPNPSSVFDSDGSEELGEKLSAKAKRMRKAGTSEATAEDDKCEEGDKPAFDHSLLESGELAWEEVTGCLADNDTQQDPFVKQFVRGGPRRREKLACIMASRRDKPQDAYHNRVQTYIESLRLAKVALEAACVAQVDAPDGKPVAPRLQCESAEERKAREEEEARQKKLYAKAKKNAEHRKCAEFMQRLEDAMGELQALAKEDVQRPPREAKDVPASVVDLLTATPHNQLLADAMQSADTCVVQAVSSMDYDTLSSSHPSWKWASTVGSARSRRCYNFLTLSTPPLNVTDDGTGAGTTRRRRLVHPVLAPEPQGPAADSLASKAAAGEVLAYLSASSKQYDKSIDSSGETSMKFLFDFKGDFGTFNRGSPAPRTMFGHCRDVDLWSATCEEEAGLTARTESTAASTPRPKIMTATESPKANRPRTAKPHVHGIRLRDFKALIDKHRAWFEEERMCQYTKRMRSKTMYDVCPELVIPLTVCRERIVELSQFDVDLLRRRKDEGGILVSDSDLTLDPAQEAYDLGGQRLPAGLTIHGRLRRGGAVRRRYWALGAGRKAQWLSRPEHGREEAPLEEVAQIPASLLAGDFEEPLGEAEDRIWDVGDLQVGDIIVLRSGVSYMEVCEEGQGGFCLDTFASHFWGEQTLDFYATLERHAKMYHPGPDPFDRTYYICTFYNNQHRVELGDTWQESPFNRALHYVADRARGTGSWEAREDSDALVAFDIDAKPLERKWCVFEAWRCAELNIPLRLFCPDGEISRNSVEKSAVHKAVLEKLQGINVQTAQCSVKADGVMIDRAIEDARGGFAAVHAKLRTCVMSLTSFIGTLAVSMNPMTGARLNEVELKMRIATPKRLENTVVPAEAIAQSMCAEHTARADELGLNKRILLVAPAGSGKSVFSRALVRHVVDLIEVGIGGADKKKLLPVRVPLAELARTAEKMQAADLPRLFDEWARCTFLGDSVHVVSRERQRLMILDGFDEAAQQRAAIMTWLRAFLQSDPKAMVLLTTRPSGLDGACLSSGRVTAENTWTVELVDRERNLVHFTSTSEPSLGTALMIEDKLCFVATSEKRHTIRDISPDVPVVQLLMLKPGEYTDVEIRQSNSQGRGAKAKIKISDQLKSLNLLGIRGYYIMSAEFTETGQGYTEGDRITLSGIPMRDRSEVEHVLRQWQIKSDKHEKDRAQERAKQGNSWKEKPDFKGKELQRTIDMLSEVRDGLLTTDLSDMQLGIKTASRFFCGLGRECPHGGAEETPANLFKLSDLKVGPGTEAKELLAREQLEHELLFSEMTIEPLDSSMSTTIIQAEAGDAADLTQDLVDSIPRELHDRPLMASMLGQYLTKKGVQGIEGLKNSWAESDVFHFSAQELIAQAATVAAPTSDRADIEDLQQRIWKYLGPRCFAKVQNAERLFDERSFGNRTLSNIGLKRLKGAEAKQAELPLWEDSRRGHLRLFEPAGKNCVQFYHLRIQELMAAESWRDLEGSFVLERACSAMAQQSGIVTTGMAPLRFLMQSWVRQTCANCPDRLVLDFSSRPVPHRLGTTIEEWMPRQLEELAIALPTEISNKKGEDEGGDQWLAAMEKMTQTMPRLRKLSLGLYFRQPRTGGGRGILRVLPLIPPSLQELNVDLGSSYWLTNLQTFCEQLPAQLKSLAVRAGTPQKRVCCRADFPTKLPQGLENLELALGWSRATSDEGLLNLGQALPPGLRALRLGQLWGRDCSTVWTFCRSLPEGLTSLALDARGMRMAGSSDGANPDGPLPLPGNLKTLDLTLWRVRDGQVKNCLDHVPRSLSRLAIRLLQCHGLSDAGLAAFLERLPASTDHLELEVDEAPQPELPAAAPQRLQSLRLRAAGCRLVSYAAVQALMQGLAPKSVTSLDLDFRGCAISEEAFRGTAWPKQLVELSLNLGGGLQVSNDAGISLAQGLPRSLACLDVSFEASPSLEDDGVIGFLAALSEASPRLRSLRLDLARVRNLSDQGLGAVFSRLMEMTTQALEHFKLDVVGCSHITRGGLSSLRPRFDGARGKLDIDLRAGRVEVLLGPGK